MFAGALRFVSDDFARLVSEDFAGLAALVRLPAGLRRVDLRERLEVFGTLLRGRSSKKNCCGEVS
jgi:hypothetical protein